MCHCSGFIMRCVFLTMATAGLAKDASHESMHSFFRIPLCSFLFLNLQAMPVA